MSPRLQVNRSWCAVLVVISGQGNFSSFRATFDRAAVPGYVTKAFTMLPFSAYSVALSNGSSSSGGGSGALQTVVLQDMIAPNAVRVSIPGGALASAATPMAEPLFGLGVSGEHVPAVRAARRKRTWMPTPSPPREVCVGRQDVDMRDVHLKCGHGVMRDSFGADSAPRHR